MSGEKRPASESFNPTTQLVVKRQKSNSDLKSNVVTLRSGQNGTLVQTVCRKAVMRCVLANDRLQIPRTSGLAAPIMELTG